MIFKAGYIANLNSKQRMTLIRWLTRGKMYCEDKRGICTEPVLPNHDECLSCALYIVY